MITKSVVLALLLLLVCSTMTAQGQAAVPQAIVFVDASTSVQTSSEDLRKTTLNALRLLPAGSIAMVYLMRDDVESTPPMIDTTLPIPSFTIKSRQQTGAFWEALGPYLDSTMRDLLQKTAKSLNSCYLKSLSVADRLFSGSKVPASSRYVVWIGDLIEDCHLPQQSSTPDPNYRRFSLVHSRDGAIAAVKEQQPRDGLVGANAIAVISYRRSDATRSVETNVLRDYWQSLLSRSGFSSVEVGNTAELFSKAK